jgi:hypothetical protein
MKRLITYLSDNIFSVVIFFLTSSSFIYLTYEIYILENSLKLLELKIELQHKDLISLIDFSSKKNIVPCIGESLDLVPIASSDITRSTSLWDIIYYDVLWNVTFYKALLDCLMTSVAISIPVCWFLFTVDHLVSGRCIPGSRLDPLTTLISDNHLSLSQALVSSNLPTRLTGAELDALKESMIELFHNGHIDPILAIAIAKNGFDPGGFTIIDGVVVLAH